MLPILTIPGYDITQVIDEGLNTIVYRGLSQVNLEPVILKVLKAEYPTLEQIARIKHEYSITANLDLEGVVTVLRLETYENRFLLVLEDFGGMSLKQYLNGEKLSLSIFLQIALQVVKSLISLHNHRIIHKDIKPSNIIINSESLQCKITDFSIASRLYQETLQPLHINQLEGTLAYISPEQTGRMNRVVDYRSDFYSLGITFYEMLTGQLPFVSDDPLELIHCHIAKEVPFLKVESEVIPQVICDIVAKLMAKNAEDRYQSAGGLLADLETCLQEFQTTGAIADFRPGLYDSSAQLNIPEKLYGREEEVTALLTAFERVAGGTSEIILVSGYSGIGKSSLVNEVHKPIVREKGYFISGKFDQLGRSVPYASVIQAFQSLMRQLLAENTDKLLIWKEKLLSALGTNGQVIINVIPELEFIIGKQPKLTQLAASEEQNRFNRVFQQFIRVFTQPQHPLVLFLDDLQWADSASLKLLEVLTTSVDIKYFLLIGAYRDNEVSFTHPLVKTLSEIEKAGTTINNIVLRPLIPIHIQQIVVDTLKPDSVFGVSPNREGKVEEIKDFAELLFNKTQGNPFFLSQLLKTLYQEKLLVFDFSQGQWVWNIQDIQKTGIADKSVVELVAGNIEKLPEDTQQLLKYAACIGARFSEYVLATVSNAGDAKFSVSTILQPALQQGLVLPLNHEYKVSLLFEKEELKAFGFDESKVTYRFLHDRVQQAAYSLIADGEKKKTHLRIGRLLLQNTPKEQLESNVIFDIVNQLNVGIDQLKESEKDELAKLNLIAGRKAKAAAAFEEAFKYLNVGLELLLADSWHHEYELTLGLYSSAVEAAYLTAKFDLMDEWGNIVLQQAKTILDKVKIYEVKIQSYIAQTKFIEAIKLGLEILELFEIKLPKAPTPLDIQQALLETATFLEGKCIEDLINLPLMSDNRKLAAMRILASIATPTVITMPALFPMTVLTQVQLSIQYGNAPFSAFSYVCYGMILQSINDIDASYEFGNLALNLAKQLNFLEIKAKTFHVVAVSAIHIKEHVLRVLPLLQEAYSTGIENGDLEFASAAAMQRCQYSYFAGLDLASLEQEIAAITHDLTKFGQITILNSQKILQQVILNLLGEADESCLLVGMWNEQTMLPLFLAANDRASLYFFYIHKLILCYLFGEYAQAVEKTEYVFQYLDALPGHLHVQISYFYDSLARLAVYPHDNTQQQQEILAKVQANQEKMQFWAQYAPMNFQHKYDLVEAEKYCLLGQNYQAMDFYDQAIAGAVENGYIQESALANERAALFYLALGKQKIAKTYMTDAYYSYIKWGAFAKVHDLEKRFPSLIIRNTVQTEDKYKTTITATISNTTLSTTNTSQILDLATVIKAGTAISSEINLYNLSLTLLHIILENAGAQKGCLILQKDNQFFVEAIESSEHNIQQSIPIAECFDIPQKLINYITKTQETLLIQDATINPIASTDPYIQQHQCKSILCVPIISQSQLIGIFYLENNLVSGAFTPARLELIKILSSQAAIAIKNARLYAKEQEKSQQLQATLTQLQQTQAQLVHTEKISSLGQLVAGVAHEVNNPVSFINGNLAHAQRYIGDLINHLQLYQQHSQTVPQIVEDAENIDLEFLIDDLPKIINSMQLGTIRIIDIMQSLRNFSRNDSNAHREVNIHEGIETTLMILSHRTKAISQRPAIEIIKEYGEIPLVPCYPGQLNQVFMNLLANAIDALEESNQGKKYEEIKNQITIRTRMSMPWVTISIGDNGLGMSEEVRQKLFNAFFTTKPEGKGTGLGLSISYQIITENHGGILDCISSFGAGATFVIRIPYMV
jgi:predicted ATPase/signal transduction histidine kinase/tRNA A-37 threonylcarbamoyl transferase component Bud32